VPPHVCPAAAGIHEGWSLPPGAGLMSATVLPDRFIPVIQE
jgi:hypothetical protein